MMMTELSCSVHRPESRRTRHGRSLFEMIPTTEYWATFGSDFQTNLLADSNIDRIEPRQNPARLFSVDATELSVIKQTVLRKKRTRLGFVRLGPLVHAIPPEDPPHCRGDRQRSLLQPHTHPAQVASFVLRRDQNLPCRVRQAPSLPLAGRNSGTLPRHQMCEQGLAFRFC